MPHFGKRMRLLAADLRMMRNADPDLVEIVSYPKTGRTWLKFMLAQLLARAYNVPGGAHTVETRALSHAIPGAPKIGWSHDESDFLTEDGRRPDPANLFLYGGRRRYARNRIVLLVRDPRDTVVSQFHQVTRRSSNPMDFASMSEFVRDPVYGHARIVRFYRVWHRNRRVPRDLLLVRYEDLMAQGASALAAISEYIGIQGASPDLYQEVYEYCRAENMRRLEASGSIEGMRTFGSEPDALKVRKARSSTYLEELSAEDIAFCNRQMRDMPAWYGYSPGEVDDPGR